MKKNSEKDRHPARMARAGFCVLFCWAAMQLIQGVSAAVQLENDSGFVHLSQHDERVAIGQDVIVGTNEVTQGVVVVGANAIVLGKVEGDLVVVGGSATVKGEVTGDVVAAMGAAKLGPESKIGGDLVVVGGGVQEAPGSAISGEKHVVGLGFSAPNFKWFFNWLGKGPLLGRWLPIEAGWPWAVAGVFLLLYTVMGILFSKPAGVCVDVLSRRPLGSFFSGVLLFLLMGPTMFVLMISVAGILVIPFLICAFVAAILFGKMSALRYLGEQLGKQTGLGVLMNPVVALLVGALLALALYTIPIFGVIAWGLLTPLGAGAVVLAVVEMANLPRAVGVGTPPQGRFVEPGAGAASDSILNPAENQTRSSFESPRHLDALSLPRVGFWRRFWASFLDLILIVVVGAILQNPFAFFLMLIGYHMGMLGWKGTTIGGAIMGIKCFRINGAPLDYGVALVRGLSAIFSFMILGLGFFWAGWDRDNQSWHDKIAGTIVVRMPPRASLF